MSVRSIEAEVSIKSGVQAECTIGRYVIVEVHDNVNLEPLTVTANGQYEPSEGVDGFSDVSVSVPERIPVTESLSVTENGLYEPTEGIDGYDSVSVAVPERVPVTERLTATSNGTYEPDSGVDGYNQVTVAVPERQPDIETLTATANGTYTSGKDGYNPVLVAVPDRQPDIEPLTVTENGTYTSTKDGYNPVIVNVDTQTDPHVYEGEFEGTETGVLTIDTGYEGNGFAKIITIYPVDGLLDLDLYEEVPNRAIGHLIFSKTGYRAPLYPNEDDATTQNRGVIHVMYKYSNAQFSSNLSQTMCLYAKTDINGMYGMTNCIRMPDNHTLKIFVSSTADSTTPSNNFLPTGIKFKWRAIY